LRYDADVPDTNRLNFRREPQFIRTAAPVAFESPVIPACIALLRDSRTRAAAAVMMFLTVSASADDLTTVGSADAISVAAAVSLSTGQDQTAGIVLPEMALPAGTDALWIRCRVNNLDSRALTLAAVDVATGETVSYWQNASPLQDSVEISAALPLSRPVKSVRLFAGTHRSASNGRFEILNCRAVRTGLKLNDRIYGVRIGPPDGRTSRQLFTATGKKIAGARILIRPVEQKEPRPDLQVRLYRWEDSLPETLEGGPLVESVIPWKVIAVEWESESVADNQIDATYEGGMRHLAIPLSAETKPGKQYLLELAAVGPGAAERSYIGYGWVGSYPGGHLFDGTRETDWDLWLEIYDEVE